jgi:hypothetical protein
LFRPVLVLLMVLCFLPAGPDKGSATTFEPDVWDMPPDRLGLGAPDHYHAVRLSYRWSVSPASPRPAPAPLIQYALQIYGLLVVTTLVARRLPATRRTPQAAVAAADRSRTR